MGQFILPDPALETEEAPHEVLGIRISSGFKAAKAMQNFRGRFRVFDQIADRVGTFDVPYEDQCSPEYYFDLVRTLRDLNGEYDRVVEIGVYMGGASVILAGCIQQFDFDLDLVDLCPEFLRFSYERIRRVYPEAASRVRLYQGEPADYVRDVMLADTSGDATAGQAIIHHDGAHDFNQVVRDLTALSYARGRVHSIIAQDTHLRGSLKHMNFVDLALKAVFGDGVNYAPIGKVYEAYDPRTNPNPYQGNYFMSDVAEGMVIPLAMNEFHYPHPSAQFSDMFEAA